LASEDEIRKEISRLARRKEARIKTFSRQRPTVWKPYEVNNPEALGMPFTEEGAWQLIAKLAEEGHKIEVISLKQPPGEIGYEMKVELEKGAPRLYIKVQLIRGKILGRSFHISTE
jgi:hypothetical protein